MVTIATTNLVRVLLTELGRGATRLVAQMDNGAVRRFLALVDNSDVANLESESEAEQGAGHNFQSSTQHATEDVTLPIGDRRASATAHPTQ